MMTTAKKYDWQIEAERRKEEDERLQRNYMVRKLLRHPCGICGSDQHKAITQGIEDDQSTIEYECPAALKEQWDPDTHFSIYRYNIELCPYKFAQMYGFQRETIQEAFIGLQEHGPGKYLNRVKLYMLKNTILNICDQQRESERRFKREVGSEEDELNDEGCDGEET